MLQKIMNFVRDEEGASAVEYGLIIGLIAVALVIILGYWPERQVPSSLYCYYWFCLRFLIAA